MVRQTPRRLPSEVSRKRLRAFEAVLEGQPLPEIDRRYMQREQAGVPPQDQPAA